MGLQNIFTTPIYTHLVPQYMADKMEEIITPKLKGLEDHGHLKTDYFKKEGIVLSKEIKPFLTHLHTITEIYSQESNIKYNNFVSYWVQDYQTYQYHTPHCHPSAAISGTYYIRSNQHAGELLFHNPNQHIHMEVPRNKHNSSYTFEIKPQKGLLVLFPSWLHHQILPSPERDVIRTSLSFNYSL